MSNWTNPVAYLALADVAMRDALATVLRRAGWRVIHEPTGFHLLEAIGELIDDESAWRRRPSMIVMDAHARGCSGVSIARGLRDLGITLPIVLVAAPGTALPIAADATLRVVEPADAVALVTDLARSRPRPPAQREAQTAA